MLEKKGIYDACKAKVHLIEEQYDALFDAVEEYKALLTTILAECDANVEYDKHMQVVANLQRNTVNGFLSTLDTDLHDDLIRLSDRVIRFKHAEDGIFL